MSEHFIFSTSALLDNKDSILDSNGNLTYKFPKYLKYLESDSVAQAS
jgi:hypothetical protein